MFELCLTCFKSLQLHMLTIYQLILQFLQGMEFATGQSASPLERRYDQSKHETTRLSLCMTTIQSNEKYA